MCGLKIRQSPKLAFRAVVAIAGTIAMDLSAQTVGGSNSYGWAAPIDDSDGQPAHASVDTRKTPIQPVGYFHSPAIGHGSYATAVEVNTRTVDAARPSSSVIEGSSQQQSRTLGNSIQGGVSPQSAQPAANSPSGEVWSTGSETSLQAAIQIWAKKAGWRVVWKASSDRRLLVPLTFRGTFQDAVSHLFQLYADSDAQSSTATNNPLYSDVYPMQSPPTVIVTDGN